jgi:histidine ammonia-lyase
VRERAAFLEHDRETSSDIEALAVLIQSGEILRSAEAALGAVSA